MFEASLATAVANQGCNCSAVVTVIAVGFGFVADWLGWLFEGSRRIGLEEKVTFY
jgi:hypothetical protein